MLPLCRLEAEKVRTAAQARAEAQSHVQDEVSRILTAERALAQESLQQAVIRERITTEDEKLRAQLLVSLPVLRRRRFELSRVIRQTSGAANRRILESPDCLMRAILSL